VNACARVVGAEGLILGDAPGFSANHVQIVGRGDVVLVTAGPERADGVWWWRVATRTGVVGWGSNDQMLPQAGACFELTVATASPTSSPTAKAGITATPGDQTGSLPSTGTNTAGLATAGILILVLVVVGLIRRRTQSAT
jgi:LPXTG-motif cell wall-anchored protein